jgi:hypothetical protein
MTLNTEIITVHLTLKDDIHDFNTLDLIFEPTNSETNLKDYFDKNPEEHFRGEILNELRDTRMWKAGLNNPEDGKPYKIKIGTITLNLETQTIENINLEKTSHHSIKPHELTERN